MTNDNLPSEEFLEIETLRRFIKLASPPIGTRLYRKIWRDRHAGQDHATLIVDASDLDIALKSWDYRKRLFNACEQLGLAEYLIINLRGERFRPAYRRTKWADRKSL